MKLLLDRNALLWMMWRSRRLGRQALTAIRDPHNQVFVSAVNAWEIAVKVALRKLDAPQDVASWLPGEIQYHRFVPLPVGFEHAVAIEHLPLHHRDPFDRLLIAQATVENLTIVTGDPKFEAYAVPLLRP